MPNRVKKEYTIASTWTAPAGVTHVNISLVDSLDQLILASFSTRFGLKRTGALAGVGNNDVGQIADQTIVNKSTLTPSLGGHSFVKLMSGDNTGIALKSDGTAWGWGDNFNGTIGDNTGGAATNKSLPVTAVGAHRFISISGYSESTQAMKADGSIWGWGDNPSGVLGDGTAVKKSSPTAVVGGHSFISFMGRLSNSFAMKADGSIWGWGDNTYGQLGDNTIVVKSSPVPVTGGHSFISFVALASGQQVIALKADGSAWMWGRNDSGVLGDGTSATNRSSPTAVVGGHSFTKISLGEFPVAIKSDGSAWTWGFNNNGAGGDGTPSTSRSSPTPIVGGHSFINVVRTGLSNSFGFKADGSVWCWGDNTDGKLGDNTIAHKSSPVAVVGGHSFIAVSLGNMALKADGTIWNWGPTSFGEIADGTNTRKSSPVQAIGGNVFQTGPQVITEKMVTVVPGTSYSISMMAYNILGIAPTQILGNNVIIVLEYDT